jgi:hypothetical protein
LKGIYIYAKHVAYLRSAVDIFAIFRAGRDFSKFRLSVKPSRFCIKKRRRFHALIDNCKEADKSANDFAIKSAGGSFLMESAQRFLQMRTEIAFSCTRIRPLFRKVDCLPECKVSGQISRRAKVLSFTGNKSTVRWSADYFF